MSNITITLDEVSPLLEGIERKFGEDGRLFMASVGEAIESVLIDHFTERDTEGNAKGWRRSHFWAQIAEATSIGQIEEDSVEVVVADYRFGYKVRGGTIVPIEAQALTIPIHEEAAGRRVSELEDELGIKLFRPGPGDGPLNLLAGVDEEGEMTFYYRLTASVDQDADPEALPPKSEVFAEIERALLELLES